MKSLLSRLAQLRTILGVGLAGLSTSVVMAGPKEGQVLAGSGDIATQGATTTITAGNNSVFQWGGFDIGSTETVRFVQPGADSRVLNFIGNSAPTHIDGSLFANGQVYLMNSAGIYFGGAAVVDVGGLYAVGGSMTKEDFLAGLNRFSAITGEVRNDGAINGSLVALIGKSVTNTGSIVAPGGFVGLVSGDQVYLRNEGSRIIVDTGATTTPTTPAISTGAGVTNHGTVNAAGGSVVLAAGDLYAVAITHDGRLAGRHVRVQGQGRGDVLVSGTIDASEKSAGQKGGSIQITGERVGVLSGAVIDASGAAGGGTVLVGGDYQGKNAEVRNASATVVQQGAVLHADATDAGNGGKVVVWSDGRTDFSGTLLARGGSRSGNGGFAEVSGKGTLQFSGAVDLRAAHGNVGSLLLDPTNIFIANDLASANGAGMTGSDVTADTPAGGVFAASGATKDSLLTITNLLLALVGADVTVTTTNAGGTGVGNITLVNGLINPSLFKLTLNAANDITINSGAAITSAGALVFTAGGGISLGASIGATAVTLTHAGALTQSAGTVTAGAINLNGAGNVGSSGAQLSVNTGTIVLNKSAGDTFITDAAPVALQGSTPGNLTVTASGAITDGAALSVTGTTTLAAGAGNDITFSFADTFGTVAITSGKNVTLIDAAGGLTLGASTISGNLDVTAAGDINQSGAVTVTGVGSTSTFRFTAAGSSLLLDTNANDFLTMPVLAGTLTNVLDYKLRNQNAAAAFPDLTGLTNLRALSLNFPNATMTLPATVTTPAGGSQSYLSAVALSADTVITANNGPVTFGGTVDGLHSLTVTTTGLTTFAGNIGTGNALTTLDVTNAVAFGGDVTTSNALTFAGAVSLSGSSTAFTASSVTFSSTLNGAANVTLNGDATFTGAVGAGTLLGSLNVTGTSAVNGGAVKTSGTQNYTGAVTLPGSTTFTGTSVTFASTLTGSGALAVTGNASFATALTGYGSVSVTGTTFLGGSVTTTGTQSYTGAVTLGSDTTLTTTDSNVTLSGGVKSAPATVRNLTISNGTGATTLGGTSGSPDALGVITLNGTGATSLGTITATSLATSATSLTLNGTITTTGGQSFAAPLTLTSNTTISAGGAVSLAAVNSAPATNFNLTINNGSGTTALGTVGGTQLLGNLALNGTGAVTLNGNVSTTGTQSYAGAVTLAGVTTFTGSTVSFNSTLAGSGALTITGGASFASGATGFGSVSVSGATSLSGAISTTTTQDYTGAVTLTGSGATLTGTTVTFGGAVNGTLSGSQALAITGNASFGGSVGVGTNLSTLAVSGATSLAGSASTTSTQTYTGAVTLPGATARTFTGSTVTFSGALTSASNPDLTVTGNASFATGLSGFNSLTVSGTTSLGGGVSTTNGQSYTGAVTLNADTLLQTTNNVSVALSGGVLSPTPHSLTISNGSGATTLGGAGTSLALLTSVVLNGTGPTALNGDVFTSGAQTYSGAVTLGGGSAGSARGLTGSLVTFGSTLRGNRALTITGNASFGGALGGGAPLTSLAVSGTTQLNGNSVNTPSGTQTYTGAVTLAGGTTFTGSTVTFSSTLTGSGALSVLGNASFANALSGFGSVAVSGTTFLGGSVTTTGTQSYNGAVTLGADTTLTTTNSNVTLTAGIKSAPSTTRNLTINNGTGATTLGGTSGSPDALGAVALNGTGATSIATLTASTLTTGAAAPVTLNGTVTTTGGGQTYSGAVTLAGNTTISATAAVSMASGVNSATATPRNLTINNGSGTTTLGAAGAVQPLGVVVLSGTGTTTLGTMAATSLSTGANAPLTLSGDITTTGAQTYNGAATLAAGAAGSTQTFTGTLVSFNGALDGNRALVIAGGAAFGDGTGSDLVGNGTTLASIAVSGATTILSTSIKTSGTQGYTGAVTLAGDTTLIGSTMTFSSTLDGTQALAITGNAVFGANVGIGTQLSSLSVSGTTSLTGNAKTSGTQVYTGAVTLTGGSTFTGSTVTFSNTLTGASSLGVVGNAVFSSALSGFTTLSVSGTTGLAGSVTTTGTQTYTGAVTLNADTVLTTTNSAVTLTAGANSATATPRTLTITNGSGATTLGSSGLVQPLGAVTLNGTTTTTLGGLVGSSLAVSAGTINLNGDIVTFGGTQSYTGAVTLGGGSSGSARGLTGSTVTFNSTLNGDRALTITGNAVLGTLAADRVGSSTALTSLTISGTTQLRGDSATTSGAQTYTGAVTLSGATTFTGSTITFSNTLGGSGALVIAGNAVFSSALSGFGSLSVSGTTGLAGNVTTTGTQTYTGLVTLNGNATLQTTNSAVTLTGGVESATATPRDLTINNGSGTTTLGASGVGQPLGAVVLNGTGATSLNSLNATSLSTGVGSAITLNGAISTGGTQTYQGAVTLAGNTTITSNGAISMSAGVNSATATPRNLTINNGSGTTTLGAAGTVQPLGVVALNGTGATSLGTMTATSLSTGANATVTLNGNVTTTGAQSYNGNTTLAAGAAGSTQTFSGTLISFNGTLDGNRALVVTGGAVFGDGTGSDLVGNGTTLASIAVSGATTIRSASIKTASTQGYTGAVTLGSDTTLIGSTMTFGSTLDGTQALAITGNAVFGADVGIGTQLSSLSVSGTTSLTGNARTSGAQQYTGSVTLTGGSTFTGSAVTFSNTLTGASTLAVVGNATFSSALSGFTTLSVSGTTGLAGSVTTSGTQTYTGAVTLNADTVLTTTNSAVTLAAGVDSATATPRNLTISNGTGVTTLGSSGSIHPLGAVTLNGTTAFTLSNLIASSLQTGLGAPVALNGEITTTGTQTYRGAVTLGGGAAGSARTLIGSTVTFNSTLDGDRALTITGNAVLGAAVGDRVGNVTPLTSLAISGTTSVNGSSVKTTGAQTYTGAVNLAGATTFTGSTITFSNTLSGSGALVVTGNASFSSALTGFSSLAVSGTTALGGSVTTTGTQTYTGLVTLNSNATLQTTNSAVTLTAGANSATSTPFNLTVNNGSGTTTLGISGNVQPLGAVALNGTGAMSVGPLFASSLSTGSGAPVTLNGAITTTGVQSYGGAVTLAAATTLTTPAVTFGSTVGGPFALTVLGNADFSNSMGGTTNLASLSVSGTTILNGNVTTTGGQNYGGSVTLSGDAVLTAGAAMTLTGGLNSASGVTAGLTINNGTFATTLGNSGTTRALGAVVLNGTGAITLNTLNASSLTTAVPAPVSLNGDITTTGGLQSYGGAVTLNGTVALAASTFSFAGGLGGAGTLNLVGNAAFSGSTTLGGLSVSGTTQFNSATTTITTTGAQTYSGAVTLHGNVILNTTNAAVTLTAGADSDSTLTPRDLTINNGQGSFQLGSSGLIAPLGVVTVNGNGPGTLRFFGLKATSLTTGTGPVSLNGDMVTPNGAQTYNGFVSLDSPSAINAQSVHYNGGLGGNGTLTIIGDTTFGGTTNLGGLIVTGSTLLSGTLTTVHDQTYNGLVTLTGDTILNGGTIKFGSGITGSRVLTINGNADLSSVSGTTTLDSFTVTGTTLLNGSISTAGNQSYGGAVSLNGDTTLSGGTILFTGGVGGNGALTISGNADLSGGGTSSLGALTVSGTTALSGNVSTGGVQTYTGAVNLRGASTLTGSKITFGNSVNGGGELSIKGDAVFTGVGGTATLGSLSVTGTTALNGGVTTTGAQLYTGAVTLGSDTTLTTGGADVKMVAGVEGGGRGLTINNGSGTTTLANSGTVSALGDVKLNGTGAITLGSLNAAALSTAGATTLNGSVTTSGVQNYGSAVTMAGADGDRTFTGSVVNFNGTLDGARGVVVRGNASFGGPVGAAGALNFLSVSGTTLLNTASIRTTGAQTYSGAFTLGANANLTASSVAFGGAVNGANALAITGNATFTGGVGTTTLLNSLSVTGTTALNGNVITSGNQTYGGAVTLVVDSIAPTDTDNGRISLADVSGSGINLTGALVAFNGTLDGNRALTITGNARFGDSSGDLVGGTSALTSLAVTGTTAINGGGVKTVGAQTYSGAVTLGAGATFTGSALTFNGTVDSNGTAAAALTANASGTTLFNGAVGANGRLGALSTDDSGNTVVRGNISAASVNFADAVSFEGTGNLTVDTTGNQVFSKALQLATGLTLNSSGGGLSLQQGATGAGRSLTLIASPANGQGVVMVGGDLGSGTARLQSLQVNAHDVTVKNIFATDDIAIAISAEPGTATGGTNASLQITGDTLDSQNGAIILGSGAFGGGGAKTGAPLRASIFKTSGDLTLVGKTVVIEPYERLAVRNGNLVIFADESITLSSTAAANALALISPLIQIRSRTPQPVATGSGIVGLDLGTDLVAGRVLFYRGGSAGAPARADLASFTSTLATAQGNLLANSPETIVILGGSSAVFIADLAVQRSIFRPVVAGLTYLDLATAPGLAGLASIPPDRFGDSDDNPVFSVVAGGQVRGSVSQAYVPSVPKENQPVAPAEAALEPAVREQLAALGIYARALMASEQEARGRKAGLFVVVPDRAHPLDEDYKVVDARVEEGSVREVLRLAAESKLIGDGTRGLSEVADALAASYEAFVAETGAEDAISYRNWLQAHPERNATVVLDFAKSVNAMFRQVSLLGLTRKEIDVSKAYIYGSILLPRLNAEVDFMRTLIENAPPGSRLSLDSEKSPTSLSPGVQKTPEVDSSRSLIGRTWHGLGSSIMGVWRLPFSKKP